MIQKNIYFGTKKLVRRRPRFVSAADVQEGRLRCVFQKCPRVMALFRLHTAKMIVMCVVNKVSPEDTKVFLPYLATGTKPSSLKQDTR